MSLDMETRLRSVLEAEVAQIEVHFDADTVHERIAAHKAFRLAQVAGFVVAGVVATAAVMIVAVVSLRIDSDSASSPGGGSLPVGTFRTDRPFDGVCAAFHLNGRTAEVPAQWWTVGNTGECSTRDSTVQTATATVSELMVAISIPTVFGNQELLTYAVVELSDQILVASVESSAGSTTAAVRLIRVATVDPIIDPVICQPGGCPDHDSS